VTQYHTWALSHTQQRKTDFQLPDPAGQLDVTQADCSEPSPLGSDMKTRDASPSGGPPAPSPWGGGGVCGMEPVPP
jgi:hypothetical protein